MNTNIKIAFACGALLATSLARGADVNLTVSLDKPGIRVSPLLYGVFFEEINRAGDGGILAELVQNRSFEDAAAPVAWTNIEGRMELDRSQPLNANNPTALRLDGRVANEGFNGIAVQASARYRLSLYARGPGALEVELAGARSSIVSIQPAWKRYELLLSPTQTLARAQLVLAGNGWIDMVSLFPEETWKGHGLRPDLMELIAAMKPAFVRFPGGCYVEGDRLENAFRWKKTIGDVAERPGHWNLWNYRSNDGLGYHEYLQMCEDLGAEPLYVINCGIAHKGVVPMDRMGEYVQDALDAIEYANGSLDTTWGALRGKAGHPRPFGLKMMEIGNENGGPAYHERYALFHDAIKAKYPDFKLIACDWRGVPTNRPLDVIDSHAYDTPAAFRNMVTRYDRHDRKGPKVYFGEYAVTKECGHGNLAAAVAEAAFLTGLERNSDVVEMSSYAPLLVNPPWRHWNPNAIVFDSSRSFGTPSYWVQCLLAANRADQIVPADFDPAPHLLYAVAGRTSDGAVIKIVNAAGEPRHLGVRLQGDEASHFSGRAFVLTSASAADENSFESPARVAPVEESIEDVGRSFERDLPPNSVTVMRLTAR